jgi:hypothetical protein
LRLIAKPEILKKAQVGLPHGLFGRPLPANHPPLRQTTPPTAPPLSPPLAQTELAEQTEQLAGVLKALARLERVPA